MNDLEKQTAIKTFENLVNLFAALTFSEGDRQKYSSLLQRTNDAIDIKFGDTSRYSKEVHKIKLYYAHADPRNREKYFNKDKVL